MDGTPYSQQRPLRRFAPCYHERAMDTTVALENVLPTRDLALLKKVGEATNTAGIRLYLVGGAVRDALLGRQVLDIDLVTEGPTDKAVRALTKAFNATVRAQSQFGTVKLHTPGRTLDLATSRTEQYARPGALPSVQPGVIEEDLWRRDFSINAMAVDLRPHSFGTLLDPVGGWADLQRGTLRALHSESFQDDATRILRAVRYVSRLGFRIDRRTLDWLKRDLDFLDTISPARLRRGMDRLLEETGASACLRLAHCLGVLVAIHPSLGHAHVGKAIQASRRVQLSALGLLALLTYGCKPSDIDGLSGRLGLTNVQRTVAKDTQSVKALEPHLIYPRLLPHQVVDAVRGMAGEAVQAAALLANIRLVRDRFRRFIGSWSHIMSSLKGRDLQRLGVPSGPLIGKLLGDLRDARIDGHIRSRRAEIAYVKQALRQVQ
jgi:tRNA nucleotidyltransferase (CCA-adding enzyme)